jgi:hypothetical protein
MSAVHNCLYADWVPGRVVHVEGGARELQSLLDSLPVETMMVMNWWVCLLGVEHVYVQSPHSSISYAFCLNLCAANIGLHT